MRTGTVITGIIATVLIIAGFVIIGGKDNNNSQNSAQSTSSQTADTGTATNQPAATTATITYNGSLFSPSQVTVKQGDSVTIKNGSGVMVEVRSNPHPVHTDNPELSIGQINAGESKNFVVSKAGSWGYHNHLDPTQTGTIVVR